jgi:hypothetical protein
MGRPKGSVSKPKPVSGEILFPEETRKDFVKYTALNLMYELVKHNGKINTDYSSIVVNAANDLADKLGIGVENAKPTKKTALVNLVDEIKDIPDLDEA